MAEGTIKRLTDKGFGFIDVGTNKDLFFHSNSLEGVNYDDLREGQRVTFTEASGQKGPCWRNRMGDKGGSRDKGKKESQKKAKLSPKEKRKAQKEKKNSR